MRINLDLNTLSFHENGFNVELDFKPYSAVLFDDKLIVGYSYDEIRNNDPQSEFWRAVWCYDKNGDILWKVESPYYTDKYTGEKVYYPCVENGRCTDSISYVRYNKEKDELIVFSRVGYRLDPETGKLGEIVYRER